MQIQYKEIPPEFQSIKPFKIYKVWNVGTFSTGSVTTIYDYPTSSVVPIIYNGVANYNLNLYTDNGLGWLSGSMWYSVRNLFYGKYDAETTGSGSISTPIGASTEPSYYDEFTVKTLSGSAMIISIPQIAYGEGIQQSSVHLYNSGSIPLYITDDGIGNLLSGSTYVGNISYDKGLIIITDAQCYNHFNDTYFTPAGNAVGSLNYTSYYTAYQNEYVCAVKANEFNNTSNPTVFVNDINGEKVFRFNKLLDASGSNIVFKPLVTGIALYDETNTPIVYAKFAKPIRMENDLDSIFMVRFDS